MILQQKFMYTLAHHTAILSSISVFFRIATASQPCYWPNGTQTDSNSIACGSGTSQCCQVGSACLNNGLCFDPGDGIPYRGACTSQDWVAANTTSCPTFCSNWSQSTQSLLTTLRDKNIVADASFWQMVATAGQSWTFAASSAAHKDTGVMIQRRVRIDVRGWCMRGRMRSGEWQQTWGPH